MTVAEDLQKGICPNCGFKLRSENVASSDPNFKHYHCDCCFADWFP